MFILLEGTGWFVILGIFSVILIYYKVIKPRKKVVICVECGLPIKKEEISARDKTTGEQYHFEHWWELTSKEFLRDLISCFHLKYESRPRHEYR